MRQVVFIWRDLNRHVTEWVLAIPQSCQRLDHHSVEPDQFLLGHMRLVQSKP